MDKNEKNSLYGKIRKLEKEVKQLRTLINNKQDVNLPSLEKQPDGTFLLRYTYSSPHPINIPLNLPFLSLPKL